MFTFKKCLIKHKPNISLATQCSHQRVLQCKIMQMVATCTSKTLVHTFMVVTFTTLQFKQTI